MGLNLSNKKYKTMLKTWRSNFEWDGGGRSVGIVSHRPVTRSNLKQERSFFFV